VNRPRSSTALFEGRPLRVGAMVVDSDTSTVYAGAESLSPHAHAGAYIPFLDYRAELAKHSAGAIVPTRTITCRYSAGGDWLVVASPTLRLAGASVHSEVLNIGSIESLWDSCNMTYRVLELAAAAQPFNMAPGLLNSTDADLGISPVVESSLAELFSEARHAWFEDGVESEFSRTFSTLVHTYGDAAVSAAQSLLLSPSTNVEVAIEAAHTLGEIDHPPSLRYRRSLLERLLLTASSVRLRHGAAAGLASMDDPSSLPVVSEAYTREDNQRLRQYLQRVVEQLERTRACPTS
jgi:hypothetical protein